jgi:UDP-N-acetyl-D-glucosamine dehydrogenase
MDKVAVIGQGYVGLPLALQISKAGMKVFGIEINGETLGIISKGVSPIQGISDEDIRSQIASGDYSVTSDFSIIKECQVIIICVPTPLDDDLNPDTSYIESAVSSIKPHLTRESLVILESTSFPGTTREMVYEPLKSLAESSNFSFYCAFSPERVDPLNEKWGIKNTPKLVAGIDDLSQSKASEFYKRFIDSVVICSSPETAEMAKLLENTYRMINISFVNEMMKLCNGSDIDIHEVLNAAGTKPFGFQKFDSGLGAGGHCIPVDSKFLLAYAGSRDMNMSIVQASLEINESLPKYHLDRIEMELGTLVGQRIIFLGVAYKGGISDIRESQTIKLMNLAKKAGASVFWFDLHVSELENFARFDSKDRYDICVISHNENQYHEISKSIPKVYSAI